MRAEPEKDPLGLRLLLLGFPASDRTLFREAFREVRPSIQLDFLGYPEDLDDFLARRGAFAKRGENETPALILLELQIARTTNDEVLSRLKSDPELTLIPRIAFSSLNSDVDCRNAYEAGATSFISKPVTFECLVKVARSITTYWIDVVRLP